MTIASLMTAAAGLAAVLALVFAAAWAARAFGLAPPMRKHGTTSPARQLVLVESLALDPRRRLTLARCGGREVLVLTGGASDVMLPMQPEAPSP